MSDFRTRIDYSNNRQIKQFEQTETTLSGTTTFGTPYSGLTSGVDVDTISTTSTLINISTTFTTVSGMSTTYIFDDPRMDVGIQGLTVITDSNSGTTQTGYGFEGNEFIELDGNYVFQNYTGSTYDLYVTSIEEISPEVFSGICQSDLVTIMSGETIDFQDRTIWVDVQGIAKTKRLIITDELDLLSGNTKVLTRDENGNVHETYITGHTENDYVTGTTFNTSTGDLTSTRLSGDTIVTNLDGRYLTAETDSQTLSFSASTGDLEISNSGNTVNLDGRYVEWTGLWANTQYTVNQQALDGDYLGIANKTTEDRLAPQPSGDKEYTITGTTATTQSNVSVINSGHEYTFTESGWVNELRVFVNELTDTTSYRVIVLDVTNSGTPISNVYEDPFLEEGRWSTISIGQKFVNVGSKFKVYIDALNSGSNSQVTGGWDRGGNEQNSAPTDKSWNTNNQGSVVRIDKDDLNSTDRSSELNGIITDSILQFVETSSPSNLIKFRTIAPPIDNGSYVQYLTVKIEEDFGGPGIGETSTLTADIPIPQSTEYKETIDYWLTNEPSWVTIEGILEYNGVAQSGVTDNAYGVDIGFTPAYLSPDWDIISVNGGASSGGSGSQTLAFSASTGDLNISDGNTVNLDDRYSFTGHTHPTDNTDDHITGATFSASTDELNLNMASGSTISVEINTDKTYYHNEGIPSSSWSVNHGLGKYPSVTIINSVNDVVEGHIDYVDLNNIILTFSAAFSGDAIFN